MTADQAIQVLGVLLSGSLGAFLVAQFKAWAARRKVRSEDTADRRHMAEVDGSLLTVARARDELEDDNRRLREQITYERQLRLEDSAQRDREKAALRAEMAERDAQHERERASLRAEIDQLENRLRDLLDEVQALKQRSEPREGQ